MVRLREISGLDVDRWLGASLAEPGKGRGWFKTPVGPVVGFALRQRSRMEVASPDNS